MLFGIGALYAIASRRLLVARNPDPFGPSAWASVGYALFFWALVTWNVVYSPDWMLGYMVPATDLPLGIVHGLFGLVLVVAGLAGHTMAAVMLQRGRMAGAIAVLVAGLVIWFGLWGLTFDRYMAMGTFADWTAGTTVPVVDSHMARSINVMGILYAIAWAVPMVLLVRASRRLRPA